MVSWSALGRTFGVNLFKGNRISSPIIQNFKLSTSKSLGSDHGHKVFVVQPSRWQYNKFKDMLHYYTMVGLIPVTIVIFYANVFIGPAQLEPIPKDYEPKHWEYHRHPITRFIARYIYNNPQQDYEKFMHYIDEEAQLAKLRALQTKVLDKMAERNDYQAYYYRPVINKYLRIEKQIGEDIIERAGDDFSE